MKGRRFGVLTVVALIVIGGAAILGVGAVRNSGDSSAANEDSPSSSADTDRERVPVVLTQAGQMDFEDRVVVSGSVHAKRYALVSARIPGTLDAVFVDEGDAVQAGQTELFQTDSVKLTKAVAIAEKDLTVAESAVQEKQAMLEKDLAGKGQAENDVQRYRELLKSNAIAKQVVEKQGSHLKQCEADVKHTQALIDLANAQMEQAQLALKIAEKDLADSLVVSPISGQVSERLQEPGEMAGAGTPVLRIEDLSLLEVSVFLPEAYYARVVPGQTEMSVHVGHSDLGRRVISYKSPTVNNKLRTFKVEGMIESPPPGIVPGCLAEVAIVMDRRQGVGIPAGAVQTRAGHSVVFLVQEGDVRMVEVQTGRQSDGWVEIVDGLSAGATVVSMGQELIEEGTPVSVVKEDAS